MAVYVLLSRADNIFWMLTLPDESTGISQLTFWLGFVINWVNQHLACHRFKNLNQIYYLLTCWQLYSLARHGTLMRTWRHDTWKWRKQTSWHDREVNIFLDLVREAKLISTFILSTPLGLVGLLRPPSPWWLMWFLPDQTTHWNRLDLDVYYIVTWNKIL